MLINDASVNAPLLLRLPLSRRLRVSSSCPRSSHEYSNSNVEFQSSSLKILETHFTPTAFKLVSIHPFYYYYAKLVASQVNPQRNKMAEERGEGEVEGGYMQPPTPLMTSTRTMHNNNSNINKGHHDEYFKRPLT